jgi:hypothetical protein
VWHGSRLWNRRDTAAGTEAGARPPQLNGHGRRSGGLEIRSALGTPLADDDNVSVSRPVIGRPAGGSPKYEMRCPATCKALAREMPPHLLGIAATRPTDPRNRPIFLTQLGAEQLPYVQLRLQADPQGG